MSPDYYITVHTRNADFPECLTKLTNMGYEIINVQKIKEKSN